MNTGFVSLFLCCLSKLTSTNFLQQLRSPLVGSSAVIASHLRLVGTVLKLPLLAGAKSGRLESLSGGSKQSQSTSSKLRLTADCSNQPAPSGARIHHVDSDADSHPRQTTSNAGPADSSRRSASVERQRTSDLSSRDVLDTVEDDKVKDEMQSEEDVAAIR